MSEQHPRDRDDEIEQHAEMDQRIIAGDSDDILDEFEDDYFHAIVTDPPYNLSDGDGFMGREWDAKGSPKAYQEWCEEWGREALRVLKPGGHLIAFSGNRTHHRLFSAVEDAGFEIRDTLTYHYGTGFPKGSDISKYIDKKCRREFVKDLSPEILERADVPDPERTFHDWTVEEHTPCDEYWNQLRDYFENADDISREVIGTGTSGDTAMMGGLLDEENGGEFDITAPATSEAEKWNGWKSQLKPATEFAVLARAPMSESAVYRNVLEHGTGALNIDRTRIPHANSDDLEESQAKNPGSDENFTSGTYGENRPIKQTVCEDGRYPANLLLDGVAARMLDSQSGSSVSRGGGNGSTFGNTDIYGEGKDGLTAEDPGYGDSGGASRFFYTSKSSKRERTINGEVENEHPTVKPLDLMEWLVTLVTAPGQRVLDPFAGSGTTIMACRRLNREGIGIEKDEEHADLARKRVELAHEIETDYVPATEPEPEDTETSDEPATLEFFGDDD